MSLALNFEKYNRALEDTLLTKDVGKVTRVTGLLVAGYVPGCSVGSLCEVYPVQGNKKILAEVVGFRDREVLMMPLGEMQGVGHGSRIVLQKNRAYVNVGPELLGRVMNGLGEMIDDYESPNLLEERPLYREANLPLNREVIREPLGVGVRAIDGLLSIGQGQRVAIMAGSGVGKSMLLGQMARGTTADVNVIALIGERGREVKEFIETNLGGEGLAKSVVVAVTSDQSPLVRVRGAYLATAVAEYFAEQGKKVLLIMDSVTRFAMALREIGLSVGEPPASKGYTPNVFSSLPRLLERAGHFSKGSITGLYSVLVEGDDMDEPIADAVRSISDGHIILDRRIAHRAHFPAIDILQSTSRVMRNVVSSNHYKSAQSLRELLAVYRDAEDLINIGAYKSGANPKIDRAVKLMDKINAFLRQDFEDITSFTQTAQSLISLERGGQE